MSATSVANAVEVGGLGVSAAERRELIALARDLAARELSPRAAAIDAGERGALAECWRAVVEVGLDRALLDERNGGAGIGADELLAVVEELAVGDGGVALCVLLCNAAFAALPRARAAAVPVGARWAAVPVGWGSELAMSAGRLRRVSLLALGVHEADGLVLLLPEAEDMRARGDGALAAGSAVQARGSAIQERCAVLYFELPAPSLEIARDEHQLGLRGAPAAIVRLVTAAGGPGSDAAGAEGAGGAAVVAGRGAEAATLLGVGGGVVQGVCLHSLLRQGAAAVARGIARRAQQLALEYARSRWQGGVPIIEHDAVRDMLSAMEVRRRCCVGAALSTAGSCASRGGGMFGGGALGGGALDGGALGGGALGGGALGIGGWEQAIAVKVAAAEAAVTTTTDAVQVFGGIGYMRETGVEKLMRDAQCCELFPEPGWVAQDMLVDVA